MKSSFQYDMSFTAERASIIDAVLHWGGNTPPDEINVAGFESMIAIRNTERVITVDSPRFREFMMGGQTATGRIQQQRFASSFQKFTETTDCLILDGVQSIELEHHGSGVDGRLYTFQTYKRRLDELQNSNYAILSICRPIACAEPLDRRPSLSESLLTLRQLDSVDQTICKYYSMGESTKDIAAAVGLTTRAVEKRRQRILDTFGFQRPIEIVKMLVRLEENGLIDAGL